MKKQKKIINETNFSEHQIEAIARCILPEVIALFESEQGQKEFAIWLAEQENLDRCFLAEWLWLLCFSFCVCHDF